MDTYRLHIRPFNPDDWKDLHEYLSQEQTVKYEPYGVLSEEESIREAASRSSNPAFLAVCLRVDGKLIGNIYMSEKDFDTWELGYVFNSRYTGQGYATEAARAVVDDTFKNKSARRITAMCNSLNVRSWRLMERLGMRREGCLVQNIYFKRDCNGNPIWADTYQYAILAHEWH